MRYAVVVSFETDDEHLALVMREYVDESLETNPPVPIKHVTLHKDMRPTGTTETYLPWREVDITPT